MAFVPLGRLAGLTTHGHGVALRLPRPAKPMAASSDAPSVGEAPRKRATEARPIR